MLLSKRSLDKDVCVRHHGGHVHVVNVEIDLPLAGGVFLPSLEISLSGGCRFATFPRSQSEAMPAVIKSRTGKYANSDDGDDKSGLMLFKKVRHAHAKYRLRIGAKEAWFSETHVRKLVRERRQKEIDVPCVVGLPKPRLGDIYLVDVVHNCCESPPFITGHLWTVCGQVSDISDRRTLQATQ